jgi:hypothetical protein
MDRALVASRANELGTGCRYGNSPRLSAESSRERLIAWLTWNDGNGCYTDESALAEGCEPLTLETAWELLEHETSEDF